MGGAPFEDSNQWRPEMGLITKVIIRHTANEIAGLGLVYQNGVRLFHGNANAGTETVHDLQPDETIVTVNGRAGNLVNYLSFTTSKNRTLGPHGGAQNAKFAAYADGMSLRYLFGRAGALLDRIGFTFGKPIAALTAAAERSPLHGGAGGVLFDDMGENVALSRIVAVKIRHTTLIHGIGLVFEDGRPEQWRGGHNGTLSLFRVPSDEDLIAVEGSSGSLVDRLRFYTTRTASVDYGGSGGARWKEEREGKIIIGLTGRSGSDLDSVGFIFLDKSRVPLRAEIIHVDFQAATTAIQAPEFCGSFTGTNSNNSALRLVNSYEYQLHEQKRVSVANTFGVELTISSEISFGGDTSPVTGKLGLSVSTSFSNCRTVEDTVTTVRTVAGQVEVEVPAKSRITTRWLVQRGTYDVPFQAIVQLTYPDGKKEQKVTSGSFTGVTAMDFQALADPAQPL